MIRKPAAYSEIVQYWRSVRSTLSQRGLLRQKHEDGSPVVPCAQAVVLPDRAIFVLDMNRLAGISREQWLNRDLWLQIRAALKGRRTYIADSAGLAIVIAREPGTHELRKLPKVIPLTQDEVPAKAYAVTLGYDKAGPVTLDLAETHRAVLVGGASGGGKTNGMQVLLAQLVMKHSPAEVRLAIVDTKEIDFAGWRGLPHLFAPVAHDLDEAEILIGGIEQERRRRKAEMVKAGVQDWRALPDPDPLLVLAVDEAADFQGTSAMDNLVEVARKGRAFGISVILGTQYPTSRVIDPQVKANLPTAIAFKCRTQTESRVILDRGGAEKLDRIGLALSYLGSQWRRVQVLRFDPSVIKAQMGGKAAPAEILSETEAALVRYAIDELDGAFTVNRLYDALGDDISRRQIVKLSKDWEARGWLTPPQRDDSGHPIGRQVTPALATLANAPLPWEQASGNAVTGRTGQDRAEYRVGER